jgi:hypothetical protein
MTQLRKSLTETGLRNRTFLKRVLSGIAADFDNWWHSWTGRINWMKVETKSTNWTSLKRRHFHSNFRDEVRAFFLLQFKPAEASRAQSRPLSDERSLKSNHRASDQCASLETRRYFSPAPSLAKVSVAWRSCPIIHCCPGLAGGERARRKSASSQLVSSSPSSSEQGQKHHQQQQSQLSFHIFSHSPRSRTPP